MTCYLLYTIFETFHQVCRTGDFYSSLGVSPTADERTIKSRFRRLAALHHPDKIQQFPNDGDSDAFFVHLRLAQDTLLDPTKRFAYDRFGAGVVNGSRAKSMREFLYAGLYALFPQYAVGFVIMTLLNLFWFSSWGRYVSGIVYQFLYPRRKGYISDVVDGRFNQQTVALLYLFRSLHP